MSGGLNVYGMITGIGDAFSKSYKEARQDAFDEAAPALLSRLFTAQATDSPAASGTLGTLSDSYRSGGPQAAKVPSFAGGSSAPMRMPGSGGEIETKFVDALKAGGLTNPFGLGAMAAYAGRESGYKGSNVTGSWSDPSESGQPGTSGGILSWRGDRFSNMRRLTAGAADPVVAQAKYALTENPDLTLALQQAKSPEEANALMAEAWKFAGWNRQGGESAARLASTRSYVASLGGSGAPSQPGPRLAQAEPDAANMPVAGAKPAEFFIPPGGGGDGPALGRPAPYNTATPGGPSTIAAASTGGDVAAAATGQSMPGQGVAAPAASQGFASFGGQASRMSQEQKDALTAAWKNPVTRPMATAVYQQILTGKTSPWKMDSVNGVSSWVNSTTGQIVPVTGVGPRFRDVTDEAGNQFKVNDLTGERSLVMAAQKGSPEIVQNDAGQRFVVDKSNPGAAPTPLGIPTAGLKIWGQPGSDGQVVQPPPGIAAGTPGYYDAKGVPQLISGKGVNVTTNVGSGETEEAKELGKLRGKRAETIEAAAMKAPDQIAKLNFLGGVLERARTGTLGPAESKVVGLAQSLGIPNETIAGLGLNPDQAVTSQVATKLTNELVTGMIGGGGFPSNNFSNSDREFLTDIFPKMSNRPEANAAAIEILKRVQQRNLEFGDAWQEYQQAQQEAGKPARVAEFEFNFRKGLRGKPDLFADLRQQFLGTPRGGTDAAGVGGQVGGSQGGAGGGSPAPSPGGAPIGEALAQPAPTAAPPPRDNRIGIPPRDANSLRSQPDTAENRQAFDAKFGAGAAQAVLRRDLPTMEESDTSLPRGRYRTPIPGGASAAAAIAEAKAALAARPDLKPQLQKRLHSYGISPKRLDE